MLAARDGRTRGRAHDSGTRTLVVLGSWGADARRRARRRRPGRGGRRRAPSPTGARDGARRGPCSRRAPRGAAESPRRAAASCSARDSPATPSISRSTMAASWRGSRRSAASSSPPSMHPRPCRWRRSAGGCSPRLTPRAATATVPGTSPRTRGGTWGVRRTQRVTTTSTCSQRRKTVVGDRHGRHHTQQLRTHRAAPRGPRRRARSDAQGHRQRLDAACRARSASRDGRSRRT